jgi:hypothetical protein
MDRSLRDWRSHTLAAAHVMVTVSAMACQPLFVCAADAFDDALRDRAAQPQQEYPFLYYLTTDNLSPDDRERTGKVLAFVIPSLSSGTNLNSQLPQEVRPGLYRIHTGFLGWQTVLPDLIRKDYPYSGKKGSLPLVIRADWFIQYAMDQTRSKDAYFRLLFSDKPIKKLEDFLAQFDADLTSNFTFAHIEGASRVAVNDVRLITTVPTRRRTDCWITYDYVEINRNTDPLENLARGIKDGKHGHDASEVIVGIPKSLPGTGETGALQAYALANGAGDIQEVAPTNIVVDGTGVRGVEIVNPVSCVSCHVEGLRSPTTSALRQYLESGAQAYINDLATQQEVDRFHLTEIQKWIERANEDYEAAIRACNGYTALENATAFRITIQDYDRPLTIRDAARELYVPVEELEFALGWVTASGKKMPARIASLAHGGTINRDSWESSYHFMPRVLAAWRSSQSKEKGVSQWSPSSSPLQPSERHTVRFPSRLSDPGSCLLHQSSTRSPSTRSKRTLFPLRLSISITA